MTRVKLLTRMLPKCMMGFLPGPARIQRSQGHFLSPSLVVSQSSAFPMEQAAQTRVCTEFQALAQVGRLGWSIGMNTESKDHVDKLAHGGKAGLVEMGSPRQNLARDLGFSGHILCAHNRCSGLSSAPKSWCFTFHSRFLQWELEARWLKISCNVRMPV